MLKEIKSSSDLHDIPAVVLTTSEAETDVARAYERNANSYLVKPIDYAKWASDTHNLTDALEMGLEVLGKPFRATDLAHAIQRALGR